MSTPSTDSHASKEEISLATPLARLSSLIDEKPEALARGDKDLQVGALQAAKFVFDTALKTETKSRPQLLELLTSISPSTAPQTRSQTAASNGKRKRGQNPSPTYEGPRPQETPLTELSVEGLDEEQIWAQLELRASNICNILEFALETTGEDPESGEEGEGESERKKQKLSLADEDVDMAELDGEDSSEDSEEETDDEGGEVEDDDEDDEDDADDEDLGEGVAPLRDPSDDEDDELEIGNPSFLAGGKRTIRIKLKKGGHPELDDGFFDLAAFNAETEEAESKKVSRGRLGRSDDSEDEGEDADEEVVDYFAAVHEEAAGGADGEELFYKDFFDPPARMPSKGSKNDKPPTTGRVRFHDEVRVKKIKAKGKSLPVSTMYQPGGEGDEGDEDDEDDEDGDEGGDGEEKRDGSNDEGDEDEGDGDWAAESGDEDRDESDGDEGGVIHEDSLEGDEAFSEDMASEGGDGVRTRQVIELLKDDLFADDEEILKDTDLSTHEKRMAALQDEIATLETENVSKKHWTLMGEATSRSRPQNALLEEDLDFERVMKTIPVITEETVKGLEERIKSRILEGRFDDVVRRKAMEDKPFLPSRFLELQDTKSKQSLAKIYEDEYTAAQTGGIAGEDRDGRLKKEHEELEKMWEGICAKLDALSNAHFTPKAPKATISTIANISAATMESALPTSKATSTMLAPEEIFAVSPSDLRARSELTPQEKRALHNKEKKAKKKAQEKLEAAVGKHTKGRSTKKQKEGALKSVVKRGKGVTVIGKESTATKKKR